MKRKLLAAVLIFAMLFSCVPTMALAEDAHNDHRICGASTCTHTGHDNAVTWTAWGNNEGEKTAMPTAAGNYYLTADVTISSSWEPANGITLCLNGHTLKYENANANGSVIQINGNAIFNLCDCGTTGKITGGKGHFMDGYQSLNGGGFFVYGTGTLNVYGGSIIDNTANYGGGICSYGTLNVYGGSIVGNTADDGGGISSFGTLNIYGGSIVGNTADDGGGVFNAQGSTFTINGGSIFNNIAKNDNDDNISNYSDNFNHPNIYIVTVTDGSGTGYYSVGSSVNIVADAPEVGKHFTQWTSSGVTFTNAKNPSITFIMPTSAVTVTANYEDHKFINNCDTICDDCSYTRTITHNYTAKSDSSEHWQECTICQYRKGVAAHTFEWVIDKPATTTETGLKHKKCTGCDATRNENTVSEKLPAGTSSSGGGFTGDYNYPVSIGDTDGADVVLSENYAIEGETVTITVNPNAGKQVDEVIVTDEDGEVITVSKVGDNQYIFTMPESKVNVSVTTEDIAYDTKVVLQIGNNNVVADGRTITNDVAPIIQGDRTLVPVRVIVEALGGNVDWNEATRTVTIEIDGKVLTLVIDKMIPGFGQGATIINDRTYVPIRYIAEYIGAHVDWIAATQQIVILK